MGRRRCFAHGRRPFALKTPTNRNFCAHWQTIRKRWPWPQKELAPHIIYNALSDLAAKLHGYYNAEKFLVEG